MCSNKIWGSYKRIYRQEKEDFPFELERNPNYSIPTLLSLNKKILYIKSYVYFYKVLVYIFTI